MGHNLDFCELIGLTSEVECPKCKNKFDPYFDDYDIDCGNPILGNGKFAFDCYCDECDTNFTYNFNVTINVEGTEIDG